ncbi:MAG: DUF1566 domain-containing protein, partial [Bacteroidia bacterium]
GNKKFHVRAVRENHIPNQFTSQFINNGNGTITDVLSDLIWQKIPNPDTLTWEQALVYADSLNIGESSDWRLPNIKELQSLHDVKQINPAIQSGYFQLNNAQKFWSSTTLPNQSTKAWYFNSQFGITTYDLKSAKHQLICVRSKQLSTGIKSIEKDQIGILVNPFHEQIKIINPQSEFIYDLSDVRGQCVFRGKNIEEHHFNFLPNGIYVLTIMGIGTKRFKLIKE